MSACGKDRPRSADAPLVGRLEISGTPGEIRAVRRQITRLINKVKGMALKERYTAKKGGNKSKSYSLTLVFCPREAT
jgi:hypothetical protein